MFNISLKSYAEVVSKPLLDHQKPDDWPLNGEIERAKASIRLPPPARLNLHLL